MTADHVEAAATSIGAATLSIKSIFISSVPLLAIALACHTEWAQASGVPTTLTQSMLEGGLRTILQLSLLGSLLLPIFQANSPFLVVGYVCFMVTLAAYEASSRTTYQIEGQFPIILASLATNVGWVVAWAFGVIVRPKPVWWNPRYVIPIVGMLLGNSISAVSLSLDNLTKALVEQREEINLWLSLGATPPEAMRRLIRNAIQVGTTPIFNTMRVIGVISIPGTMTGQLLGGSSAVTAARYQIFLIFMIATSIVAVVLTNAFLVVEFIGFDTHHGFVRADRLTKNHRPSVTKALAMFVVVLTSSSTTTNDFGSENVSNVLPDIVKEPTRHLEIVPLIGPSTCIADQTESEKDNICTSSQQPYAIDDSTLPHLHVRQVTKSFPLVASTKPEEGSAASSKNYRVLFNDLSFSVTPGEMMLVKGSSGAGKSTLLQGLAGLLPFDQGAMMFGSADWKTNVTTYSTSAEWRRNVRYVAQSKVNIPGTPADMIEQASRLKTWQYSPEKTRELVEDIVAYLEEWGVATPDAALRKEWSQLSGGESQRILIAMTLASRPSFILFDEATSALDKTSKMAVERSVRQFVFEGRGGVLWISHDEDQANRMAIDRTKLM